MMVTKAIAGFDNTVDDEDDCLNAVSGARTTPGLRSLMRFS